jgi:hypothetical protein
LVGTGLFEGSGVFKGDLVIAFDGGFTGVFGGLHSNDEWFHRHLRSSRKTNPERVALDLVCIDLGTFAVVCGMSVAELFQLVSSKGDHDSFDHVVCVCCVLWSCNLFAEKVSEAPARGLCMGENQVHA